MVVQRPKTAFACSECGSVTPKWVGQCPRCEAWNAVEKITVQSGAAQGTPYGNGIGDESRSFDHAPDPVNLADIPTDGQVRISTAIAELDTVLGGGLVKGAAVLIAGDPGVGKSTLLLQCAAGVAGGGNPVLFATGEESQAQVKLRAERLGITARGVAVVPTGDVQYLGTLVDRAKPALLMVDSIQTAWHGSVSGPAGSIAQVKNAAAELCLLARRSGAAVVMTGHVTKDGSVAGPKVLEHIVDIVLQMESGAGTSLRLLRGAKNRHGTTDELGVFEMTGAGLSGVAEPSAVFLSQRQSGTSGSAVATVIEGSRPLTVEVQALVAPTQSANPRRTSAGYDLARLQMLIAVISKRLNLPLASQDIVVNIAGGLKVRETAADLAVALAVVSSYLDIPVKEGLAAAGEIGLAGELRSMPQPGRRINEAARLGFERIIVPASIPDPGVAEKRALLTRTLADAVRLAIASETGDPADVVGDRQMLTQ